MRRIVAAVLFLAAASTDAGAQSIEPGTRVRVSTPYHIQGREVAGAGGWQVGRLVAVDTGSIILEDASGEIITLPLELTTRVEVSGGAIDSSEGAWRGARTGAVVGLGIGGAYLGLALLDPSEVDGKMPLIGTVSTEPGYVARAFGVATVVGAGLGYLFGSDMKERWVDVGVPLPAFSLDAQRGARLEFSLGL